MKKINIQCYDNGRATLKTKDIHIESENIASIIEVDFSQVEYKNYQKGLDIQSGSYLLRYFLGNDEIVFKELTYENTLPGELVITPFVFDEETDRKVRYLTDYSVIIHKKTSIVSHDAPDNADIILEEIKKFLGGGMTAFVGTREEYNLANDAGQIPSGTLVIITDEEEEIPDSSTTAVLGAAKLGSMILGHE